MKSSSLIHPTAQIHPGAKIGSGTRIGAFCVVDDQTTLGNDCEIQDHVVIRPFTRMGDGVRVFSGAVLGSEPQHLKFKGEETYVEIGNQVLIREYVTIHRGTEIGGGITRVGDQSMLMAYCHIAHDCLLGRNVILANGVQLAGHVEIGDFVTLGGLSAVVQFCRIGRFCYTGGASHIRKDVVPFTLGKGIEYEVQGINSIGLERNGVSGEEIQALKQAYKTLFVQKQPLSQALEKISGQLDQFSFVQELVHFIQSSKVGIHRQT